MKVGFIGLGRMGQGMAGRILSAGHEMLVHDPFPGQADSLVAAGAVAVDSPAAATVDRDVVISMLPSDKILAAVLESDGGLLGGMADGCIHMAMGTHGVAAGLVADFVNKGVAHERRVEPQRREQDPVRFRRESERLD